MKRPIVLFVVLQRLALLVYAFDRLQRGPYVQGHQMPDGRLDSPPTALRLTRTILPTTRASWLVPPEDILKFNVSLRPSPS